MLLAAGKGERMRPLTASVPKPLLKVRDKPLIAYHLEALARSGVSEVVINVSWLGEQIVAYCGDGAPWGLKVSFSPEQEPLETAGGIVRALPKLGSAPFLLANADIHTDYDFSQLTDSARQLPRAAAKLVLVTNPQHNPEGDFSLSGNRVTPNAGASLTYAGIGLYDPAFFAGCAPGKRPLRPLLNSATEEGRLLGEHYPGRWTDVGTPDRLAALNAGE